jgi:hypothetical protein
MNRYNGYIYHHKQNQTAVDWLKQFPLQFWPVGMGGWFFGPRSASAAAMRPKKRMSGSARLSTLQSTFPTLPWNTIVCSLNAWLRHIRNKLLDSNTFFSHPPFKSSVSPLKQRPNLTMYMYRKAMPRSSKILDEKWQQHLRDMHHKRMKTIRPEIDNKAPPRFVHLAQVRSIKMVLLHYHPWLTIHLAEFEASAAR